MINEFEKSDLPDIHLNGTSLDDLRELYTKVYVKLTEAGDAHNQLAPHTRDYYTKPNPSAAYKAARARFKRQAEAIAKMASEVVMEFQAIEDRAKGRSS